MIIIGDMKIDNSSIPEITDFTCDEEAGREYVEDRIVARFDENLGEMTFTARINRIAYMKIIGVWDWTIENCPDKRVKHLMKNHKDDRVKYKNFRHATRLIGKILEKGANNEH